MKTYEDCLLCFERQAFDACRLCCMGRRKTDVLLEAVRARIQCFPCSHSPVEMAVEIHQLVLEAADGEDPYRSVKEESNRACRESMSVLSECMAWSFDPFETATKLAIAGNIIDFGVFSPTSPCRRDVAKSVQNTVGAPLAGNSAAELREAVDRAVKILYVADNAGECFFDTFLLDQLPAGKTAYAVRGSPVLNDATLEDARAAGIDKRCRIIDTGDNAPGVLLERCSAKFRQAFDEADLVVAKGQGNYESLSETSSKTCAFLTKVKCPVIARDIGHPVGSNVVRIINFDPGNTQGRQLNRNSSRTEVCYA